MIRHTLLLRFGAEATQRERDATLQSLIALCDRVGEVASLPAVQMSICARGRKASRTRSPSSSKPVGARRVSKRCRATRPS